MLERHVSSITLVSSPACANDPQALASAERKANKDFHPDKKGRLIKEANEQLESSGQLSPRVHMSFGMISAPQLNREFACTLAFHHVQALFSLVTSLDPRERQRTRLLPLEHFKLLGIYKESDWGNPQLLEVINRTQHWEKPVHVVTANGFFKAVMRRDNDNNSGWFWALEWNKNYRVVGAISQPDTLPSAFQNLPELNWIRLNQTDRIRQEIPLGAANDTLFASTSAD